MSYPYVPAANDYGPRKGPALAFVIHMAEGGGTVAFLSGPNVPRGVSVHYVIERTGRIVQMLPNDHASGSINPQDIRKTDDPGGFYGRTAAVAVMGKWADDPNSACISVEIEGFAASGPNTAQNGSLATLTDDLRHRFPGIGLLGHRDFQDYKPCPGKLIPWSKIGGHGPAGETMGLATTLASPITTGSLAITKGADSIRVSDATHYTVPSTVNRDAVAASLTGGLSSPGFLIDLDGDELHFIRDSEPVDFTPTPDVAAADCTALVTAEHDKVKAAAVAAVEAIP